ncbi:serine hydrolase domain-containing protein [Pseudomonas sp. Marseille-QA0892]
MSLRDIVDDAEKVGPLQTLMIARNGKVLVEKGYRGHRTTQATNIKSASKSVISALVGIAIDRGVLNGPHEHVAALLSADLPQRPDPRMATLTVGHLLSMQAGLGSTSGQHYGGWVASRNWVRAALARPFMDEPGGAMIYSTGSTHLLSAILTKKTGRSTLQLAQDWLGSLDRFSISNWTRDPQGIYMGGNEMAMTTRSLLAFGELYANGGLAPNGARVLSEEWIAQSWTPRTRSRYTGDGYGYGWFLTKMAGEEVRYGWGYGGQMIYVVPRLGLTVAMTSGSQPSGGHLGHRAALHQLMERIIIAAEAEKT